MSWIELSPELAETNKQLKRIADSLSIILKVSYNIHLPDAPKIPDPSPAEEPTVAYSDDISEFKNVFSDLEQGLDPERTVDVDDTPTPQAVWDYLRKQREQQ